MCKWNSSVNHIIILNIFFIRRYADRTHCLYGIPFPGLHSALVSSCINFCWIILCSRIFDQVMNGTVAFGWFHFTTLLLLVTAAASSIKFFSKPIRAQKYLSMTCTHSKELPMVVFMGHLQRLGSGLFSNRRHGTIFPMVLSAQSWLDRLLKFTNSTTQICTWKQSQMLWSVATFQMLVFLLQLPWRCKSLHSPANPTFLML